MGPGRRERGTDGVELDAAGPQRAPADTPPWLVAVAIWGGVALFSVVQIYVSRAALGEPPPLGPLLLMEVPVWGFWALLTVPVVVLARRFPLDRPGLKAALLAHGAAAVGIAVVSVVFRTAWYQTFNPYPLGGDSVTAWFWQYFRQYFAFGVLIYWGVVGVWHAFTNYVLYRERELEVSRAKAQLGEARLNALEMQLHPHFLFNTLNSVSALLEGHPADARRVLAQLADLLRASLRTDARHVIPLEDELEFVQGYLDIERVRFGERLVVDVDVAPEALRAGVPSFLLQPLVENAIRHGIAPREEGGRVWISAERADGRLVIHVRDDGRGLGRQPPREGIGLANTRKRLRELYGPAQVLSLEERPGGGLDVRVEIPFRTPEPDG